MPASNPPSVVPAQAGTHPPPATLSLRVTSGHFESPDATFLQPSSKLNVSKCDQKLHGLARARACGSSYHPNLTHATGNPILASESTMSPYGGRTVKRLLFATLLVITLSACGGDGGGAQPSGGGGSSAPEREAKTEMSEPRHRRVALDPAVRHEARRGRGRTRRRRQRQRLRDRLHLGGAPRPDQLRVLRRLGQEVRRFGQRGVDSPVRRIRRGGRFRRGRGRGLPGQPATRRGGPPRTSAAPARAASTPTFGSTVPTGTSSSPHSSGPAAGTRR